MFVTSSWLSSNTCASTFFVGRENFVQVLVTDHVIEFGRVFYGWRIGTKNIFSESCFTQQENGRMF